MRFDRNSNKCLHPKQRYCLVSLLGSLSLLNLGATGCHEPPKDACQGVSIRWPFLDIDPSDDVSPSDGLQIDLQLITGLRPQSRATLLVSRPPKEDEDPANNDAEVEILSEASAEVHDDGVLDFLGFDMPFGAVRITVESETSCGTISSSRSTFVWDQQGQPRCVPSIMGEQFSDGDAFRVVNASSDQDTDTDGVQALIRVDTGRDDMEVRLFGVSDVDGQDFDETSASSQGGNTDFVQTLANGRYDIRALCDWPSESKVFSSSTISYLVEDSEP